MSLTKTALCDFLIKHFVGALIQSLFPVWFTSVVNFLPSSSALPQVTHRSEQELCAPPITDLQLAKCMHAFASMCMRLIKINDTS